MTDCIIGTWTVGRGSDIDHHSIRDVDQNLSSVDVVLYRRHCDICANDLIMILDFSRSKALQNMINLHVVLNNNR